MINFELINYTANEEDRFFEYELRMHDGSHYCGRLEFQINQDSGHIEIRQLHIERKHQHTDKHYGSIILDYALNRMFINTSEICKTIFLVAHPFEMSYWRIIKHHKNCMNIPALLKYLNVDSLDKVTKKMCDDMADNDYDDRIGWNYTDIFDFTGAEEQELSQLIKFYQRFGFNPTNAHPRIYEMNRPNKIIPVSNLVSYKAGKLKTRKP
jgi:hypothetical protein